MITDEREGRCPQRMKRKKAVLCAAIERPERDQGRLLVLTGKGKSSSAFGMAVCWPGKALTL